MKWFKLIIAAVIGYKCAPILQAAFYSLIAMSAAPFWRKIEGDGKLAKPALLNDFETEGGEDK